MDCVFSTGNCSEMLAAICNSRFFYNVMNLELQHPPSAFYSLILHLRTACIDDVELTDSEALWNAWIILFPSAKRLCHKNPP